MRKRLNRVLKNRIFIFILGGLILGSAGVLAATYFPSSDVTYDNSSSGLSSTDVQGAIDELYNEFSTTVVPPTAGNTILDKVDIVTSGDGLYKDEYEDGRYLYKGADPNNYITFNNETAGWRILSIESDGSIKITRTNSIMNSRWNGGYSIWKTAELNIYLNGEYYSTLNEVAQSQIINHNFSIGAATKDNNNLATQIDNENSTKWSGNIALITLSEYLRTNTNPQCNTIYLLNANESACNVTNWLYYSNTHWWTLTAVMNTSYGAYIIRTYGSPFAVTGNSFVNMSSYAVRPTLYLSPNITLKGTGTLSDPYTIQQ